MKLSANNSFPWQFTDTDTQVIPFPSSRNLREVSRAARAIVSGRSPGVYGWIDKQARQHAITGITRDLAEKDLRDLEYAINSAVNFLIAVGGANG